MKQRAIEGVNLGGWLLLERWMTPSVFAGTDALDEFNFSQIPGAKERIEKHRQTFMVEADWQWLAAQHITHVRLPVGYWVLEDDAPYFGAAYYLDWAFEMAEKYDIKILLDLHGLKGSQNAEMHSGRIGHVEWKKYIDDHIALLETLAKRYADSAALWAIEIINEPRVVGQYFALLRYYRRAYTVLRSIVRPGTYIIFHDGFMPLIFSGALRAKQQFPVVMDTHFYGVFPGLLRKISAQQYDGIRGMIFKPVIWLTQLAQPLIIGEWGSVVPQHFFDRVPQEKHLPLIGETITRQRHMYHRALATFYWNYKTEGRGMYNYRSLIEDGIITHKV